MISLAIGFYLKLPIKWAQKPALFIGSACLAGAELSFEIWLLERVLG